jgi:hypothetical protein
VPPLEAWEKVFIKLSGKTIEEIDVHLSILACTDCHGGDAHEQDDRALAHEGLIADPAGKEHLVCGQCHASITKGFANSLHLNLWGEMETIAARAGVDSFEQCPESLKSGFKGECGSCHASCGDCHVSRPDSVGKGFVSNHAFKSKPHQKNQCMACHGSRVAFDFMGDPENGRSPSAHFAKGMDCMKCHGAKEMHADAAGVKGGRYHLPEAPRCEDCHDIPEANEYHSTHWDDLSCHVCHGQPYNNCTACHTAGGWKTDEEYLSKNPALDFRIGVNPLPDRRHDFVTVRHAPVATSTYDNWGAQGTLVDYAALPTWKFATPHNVRRWTERTEVSGNGGCAANCHIGAPMGDPANVKYYLFKDYVESNWPLEVEANQPVYVDDELPDGWK